MAVPKKRTGHSDQGHRRSNWKATVPAISSCPNCGAPRHPHTLCGVCGFYKDRVVLKAMLDEDISTDAFFPGAASEEPAEQAPEVAEEKPKKAKKSAKKEEAPAEEPAEEVTDASADADTSDDDTEN